jgi:hypothetical protein
MDSLQKWWGLYFDVQQVTRFLANYRNRYGKHTKYVEIEIALRFVLSLSKNQKTIYRIGFPTLLQSEGPITLADIFERKMALDEDFDIVIAPKGQEQLKRHNLQIVRFTGDVELTTEGLLKFLKQKKFHIPKDENLLLLVWLEKGLKLNYIELGQKLEEINVPYGQIFLVGETKRDKSDIFFCLEVFPEVIKFKDLDLGFLKSGKNAKT